MEAGEGLSLEQIRAFLEASDEVEFKGSKREEIYEWVNRALQQQGYRELGRSGKGLVRRYIEKMTGLSRAQATRLVTQCQRHGRAQCQRYRRRRFPQRYSRADIELLATVDQ